MSDSSFGRWATPEVSVTIDYSHAVMEEIRERATEGFQRLARGGIEIGGVLFGKCSDSRIVIAAERPVECTYARGPQFVLSESDRQRFAQVVESHRSDPELAGLVPVGWYVSHTRSELVVNAADQEIHAAWFPELWQPVLVLRPGRVGGMRAGFVLRAADGTFRSDRSALEFNVDPLRQASPRAAAVVRMPAAEHAAEQAPEQPESVARPRPRRRWLAAVIATCLVVAGIVAGVLYFYPFETAAVPAPIALQVREVGGELRAEWNRKSPAILKARNATLEISDEGEKRSVTLSPDQLSVGAWPFLHRSGDVSLKLRLTYTTGEWAEEAARYLGQPVKPPESQAKAVEPAPESNPPEDGNARLRKELKQQRARVAQLEKRVAQLNDLLRIERDRSDVLRKK